MAIKRMTRCANQQHLRFLQKLTKVVQRRIEYIKWPANWRRKAFWHRFCYFAQFQTYQKVNENRDFRKINRFIKVKRNIWTTVTSLFTHHLSWKFRCWKSTATHVRKLYFCHSLIKGSEDQRADRITQPCKRLSQKQHFLPCYDARCERKYIPHANRVSLPKIWPWNMSFDLR